MPTFQQYIKNHRIVKKFRSSTPHFHGAPHKYGVCLRVGTVKPKKPNSAKVSLSNKRQLIAYIPGMGHNLQKHSSVMVRGGRVPDLPGCRYHIMRGKVDFHMSETFDRKNRRSKFAKKNPIKQQKHHKEFQ